MRRQSWMLVATGFLVATAATLPASPPATTTMSRFGAPVVAGDGEVFVGEAQNQSRPGRVYVYRKLGGHWIEAAVLESPAAAVADGFGARLSLDGDYLAVGRQQTAVHVFHKRSGVWTHAGAIESRDVPGGDARFGGGLLVAGDRLWIGRPFAARAGATPFGPAAASGEPPPPPPAGAVYAFQRDADGRFVYRSTIKPAASQSGDNFGMALAGGAPVLLVGAPGHATNAGLVYEFAVDKDGAISEQRSFAPPGLQANDGFGAQIVWQAPLAIVAAPDQGRQYPAAYAFRRAAEGTEDFEFAAALASFVSGGGGAAPKGSIAWREVARLTSPVGTRFDRFSTAMAISDREVWIGAFGSDAGRVFVYPFNASGFQMDGVRVIEPSGDETMQAGNSVSVRGNLAAVGAPNAGSTGGVLIYERDDFGSWKLSEPMISPPLDEIAALTGAERRCPAGGKIEMFECGAVDLLSFLPPSRLSFDGRYAEISSIWGWTDPETGREWAIIGRETGASFVDITKPSTPVVVADLPPTPGARPSSWREIKVYKDHALIVSDGSGPHGVQIFDLRRLRTLAPRNGRPQRVEADVIYRNVASVHNIVVNEASGFAYAVGSNGGGTTCGGGLHMIDVRDPKAPVFAGCYADNGSGMAKTGYSHDAQCVNYDGPDKRYTGREICIGSNETAISIADVTDKAKPKFISRASHPTGVYLHQGWFDERKRYFYVNDEGDEMTGAAKKTRTLIWDLADLENPVFATEYLAAGSATDHNLYIKGQIMYQANYTSGLRMLSIKDPLNPREIGFFDTAPYHPSTPSFNGAWSVYPYFKSGTIIVSSIEQGLFVLRASDR